MLGTLGIGPLLQEKVKKQMMQPGIGAMNTGETQGEPLDLAALLGLLARSGHIDEADCQHLLRRRRSAEELKKPLLAYVAAQNLQDHKLPHHSLDVEALTQILATQAGQPYCRIDPLKIDVARVTRLMSYAFAERHQILVIEEHPQEIVVAGAEPFVTGWEDDLAHTTRKAVRRVVANPLDIRRFTTEFYSLASSIRRAEGAGSAPPGLGNLEQMLDLGKMKDPEANDQHIVSIVDWLLQYAFAQRASDIHIEPRREKGNIRFRIDGVLYTVYALPMKVLNAVTSRLKVLGRMNVAEKRKPQDGRLKTRSPNGDEVELRLSTLPTAFGEKMVLRVFDPEVLLRPFESLGLSGEDLSRWQQIIAHNNGIVIITGPTGSGKTTTLYSTLKSLATEEVNVCTIEDPIEMVVPAFNQMQVQENIDLDFASGVRALLRQDPDIMMIGEIRDIETAEMAVQAALTGHLVFTTLHTNDAPSAITRLLELGVPSYLIKATVVGIVAQRLVRVLCPHCKQAAVISDEDWKTLTRPWKVKRPEQVAESAGCLECRQTGFRGRQGLYEIMPFTESLYPCAETTGDLPALREAASREGMRSLRLSGARAVASGITTVNEVLRVTPEAVREHKQQSNQGSHFD